MSDTTRPRLVLVGPPGSGKTTVGSLLAARWAVTFRDTDRDVEAHANKPISDIFVDDGEAVFRRLESAAVREALASHAGVLALGGGAVMDTSTRSALAGHRVAFLDVGLAEASSRVGLGATRPLLLGNVRGQLKALLDARRPLYRDVATVQVLTDGRSAQEVADAVERELAAQAGGEAADG
ncbi:MAG: shikimate kinase, partial [Actinomycetota bacterium]|nr:shikimate kinase [Actinomycetota bacterium]